MGNRRGLVNRLAKLEKAQEGGAMGAASVGTDWLETLDAEALDQVLLNLLAVGPPDSDPGRVAWERCMAMGQVSDDDAEILLAEIGRVDLTTFIDFAIDVDFTIEQEMFDDPH